MIFIIDVLFWSGKLIFYLLLLFSDNRLKKYAQERKELLDEITKLKFELEEERIKSSGNCFSMMNGSENDEFDDTSKKKRQQTLGIYF